MTIKENNEKQRPRDVKTEWTVDITTSSWHKDEGCIYVGPFFLWVDFYGLY